MKQNDTEGKPEKSYTMLVTNITFITSYNKTRISSIPNNPQSWNIINHFCGFLWDSYGIPMDFYGFLSISPGILLIQTDQHTQYQRCHVSSSWQHKRA